MTRALMASGFLWTISATFGQTPAQPLAFEVSSVKASAENDRNTHDKSTLGTLWERNQTLQGLIQVAYGMKDYQISGGPKWMSTDRYDINGKANYPAEDSDLFRMLQTLLAERFKLAVHRETKPYPGYALVAVKGGVKMKTAGDGEHSGAHGNGASLVATAESMARFTVWLSRRMGAPVMDATALSGAFDFKLEWSPEGTAPQSPAPGDPTTALPDHRPPALLTAIEEQLGLRLEARKIPIEMIVVDHVEKATEN